jgi:putative ABC transport system permease protein
MWTQFLAIGLVLAAGVATLIMSVGSYQSLYETRATYYDRFQFAHVFANTRKAPNEVIQKISAITGVASAEGRIGKFALLDLPNVSEPATGFFLSFPDDGQPMLNKLYLRAGRTPESGSSEVVIDDAFAKAHDLSFGTRFSAVLNGRWRELTVVGVAMSPEFIYAIGPGEIMPDPRRFGAMWMSEKTLAAAFDFEGAFSSVYVRVSYGAIEHEIIQQVDALLDRYGGQAAYGRNNHISHAFLDHELDMLRNMSRTLPPIFLLVAAFLVNITVSRLVTLDREQIGLLKALGYSNASVTLHYLKFVALLVLTGVLLGSAAGTWLGTIMTRLFGEFFRFPFLVFIRSPGLYALATALSAAVAFLGAFFALRQVFQLSPAASMQPPAPPAYRETLPSAVRKVVSASTAIALRNIAMHPFRALFTSLGMALATAILVVSLFTRETMEQLIDVTFFLADRQDATINFGEQRSATAVELVSRLPGVLVAEPVRQVPVRIRNGSLQRRIIVSARKADADLNRIIDTDLRPVQLPDAGIAISGLLGKILSVSVGDEVEIDVLDGHRQTVRVPIAALVEDYFGIRGTMTDRALASLLQESPTVNAVSVSLDKNRLEDFYDTLKKTPFVSGVSLQWASLEKFRETLALLITTMASIYTGLAATIALGVVYNSARIAMSERARDLASLRVLGFTQREVFWILLLEIALLTILAQAPGWAIGYGLAWIMRNNLAGELMRVRLFVENATYAIATTVVLTASIGSAAAIWRRITKLDLVAVLKTRD